MELKKLIVEIRNKQGLSQEEMAAKLFVTRQAVSRWENGETTPSTDTLKMISKLFDVTPSDLLGFENSPVCQSCGMDLQNIDDFGTTYDDGIHTEYCQYCMRKGQFTHERTIDEMVESNLRFLDEYNKGKGLSFTPEQARIELKQHLASLKRWR